MATRRWAAAEFVASTSADAAEATVSAGAFAPGTAGTALATMTPLSPLSRWHATAGAADSV